MKKIIPISVLLLLLPFNFSFAQSNVSKSPQAKTVLLEEFTGIHCGYCPQGHQIAKNLLIAQEGNIYVLAIHTGGFSEPGPDEPDFRCDYGVLLYMQSGQAGFPSGTINREVLRGDISALGKGEWGIFGREIVKDTAKVNLWMEVSIDANTREASIKVEGYYTKELNSNFALLNIAMTENNIKGPQSGAGMGSDYIHQHMLRDFITGQWGDTLYNPTMGETFTKTYTYKIPDSIKKVEVKLQDLEFIAFVTLDTMHVLNVTDVKPITSNLEKPLAGKIQPLKISKTHAYTYFSVILENFSSSALTSADFLITIGENSQTCTWTGNIAPFSQDVIEIPLENYPVDKFQNYSIELKGLNGQAYSGNKLQGVFQAPSECTQKIYIDFMTDEYGADNIWYIKDREGNIIKQVGPFPEGKAQLYKDSIEFATPGIYSFEITDAWANGIGGGYYKLYNTDRTMFNNNLQIFDFGDASFFNTVKTVENEKISLSSPTLQVKLYPNPASENNAQLEFTSPDNGQATISVFDIQGKKIYEKNVEIQANTRYKHNLSNLKTGFYFVKIAQDTNSTTSKLIIK